MSKEDPNDRKLSGQLEIWRDFLKILREGTMSAAILYERGREDRVMEFGKKLARLRNSMGWSQEQLHQILGDISKSKISDWEIGKFQPNRIEIARLAEIFGVDVEYLVLDAVETPHKSEMNADERTILRVVRALGLEVDDVIRGLNMVHRPEPPKETGTSTMISRKDISSERARKLAEGEGKNPKKGG